jgi:hypothetical protein
MTNTGHPARSTTQCKKNGAKMTLSLTHEEAQSKLSQIEQLRTAVLQKLNQIQARQQDMLGSSWKGGSTTTYGHTSASQHDDMNQVAASLNRIVDTATAHINSIVNADNN